LGLSIVYQIIRDHSGTINVRSREGQGTTITIEFPKSQ
jgi:signal transduction histidine kinase